MIQNVDQLDLMILQEMEQDGRRSISELGKKLNISRAYAGRKLQKLLDQQTTKIVAFTNPAILGYHTVALIGIQVVPGEINEAAIRLAELSNVHLVVTTAGQQDIIIWAMFKSHMELSEFLGKELGTVPGITSTETTIVLEMRKLSFSFVTASGLSGLKIDAPREIPQVQNFAVDSQLEVDHLDVMMLKQLEEDARQPISDLAKKLGVSRAHTSARLQRLLDRQLTRIVAFTNPFLLGYNFFSLIGIKVSPREIDTAADKLGTFPDIFMVAKTAGRHDIVVWAVFKTPLDLSAFIMEELAGISGITSTETIIALELRKMAFMYLASSMKEETL